MGSVQYGWGRSVAVLVPTSGPPAVPSGDQVVAAVRALEADGFSDRNRDTYELAHAAAHNIAAGRPGPRPVKAGDGDIDTDFLVEITAYATVLDGDPTLTSVTISVRIETPCLR